MSAHVGPAAGLVTAVAVAAPRSFGPPAATSVALVVVLCYLLLVSYRR